MYWHALRSRVTATTGRNRESGACKLVSAVLVLVTVAGGLGGLAAGVVASQSGLLQASGTAGLAPVSPQVGHGASLDSAHTPQVGSGRLGPIGPAATAGLTVYPILAQVGTVVTLNGTNYTPSSVVTVTLGAAGGVVYTARTLESNATGAFSFSYSLPSDPAGAHVFTAKDTDSNSATATITIIPLLLSSPSVGPAGTTAHLFGWGFASHSSFRISGPGGTCSGTQDGLQGNLPGNGVPCNITIPDGTPRGNYTFTGSDGVGDSNSTIFEVNYTPILTVSPMEGQEGSTVTLNGTNYSANSAIRVTWDSGASLACTSETNATGSFTCPTKIPFTYPSGTYLFTGTDSNAGSDTKPFTVVPVLIASPGSGPPGTTVRFKGYGYASGQPYTISWTGGVVCSGKSGGDGDIPAFSTCNYTIPTTTPHGTYGFTGTAGGSNTTLFAVLSTPSVGTPNPSRPAADVGQQVEFSTNASGGSGTYTTYTWTESSPLMGCTLASAPSVSCDATAKGNFTVTVTVTDSNGLTSPASTSADFVVSPDPTIQMPTANQSNADVGQAVSFTAVGSSAPGGLIYNWSGLPGVCTGTTSPVAMCTRMPTAGTYAVSATATDSNGFNVSSIALLFSVHPDPTVVVAPVGPLSYSVGQGASPLLATVTYAGSNTVVVEWYSSTGSACGNRSTDTHVTGTTLAPSTASAGTIYYCAVVSDGGVPGYTSSSAPIQVTVTPAPTSPSTLAGLPPTEAYLLFGGIGAAVVAGIAVVAWRRGKAPPAP
jgi:hypothetical protein